MGDVEEHRCPVPQGRQPIDISPWTCPECGMVWKADPPLVEGVPAPSYDFATDQGVVPARWVRADDTR